jgi:hypothetical protein
MMQFHELLRILKAITFGFAATVWVCFVLWLLIVWMRGSDDEDY